jgi:4'-phosphopantetheinyl transferase
MLPLHVLVQSAAGVPAHDDWLAPEEVERLAGFRIPKRRTGWRLGRYAAKRLLAARLPEPPAWSAIVIRAASDGAPEAFIADQPVPFTLSISHREGLAFCAVVPGRVALGCDVERIEPRSTLFVQDYLTPDEQRLVREAPESERSLLANLIWSAKESALKALREGLRLDTRSVEVTLGRSAEEEWRPLSVRAGEAVFTGWWGRSGEYVFTVVARPAAGAPLLLRGAGLSNGG